MKDMLDRPGEVRVKIFPDDGESFEMIFRVPAGRDIKEFIEERFDEILNEGFRYSNYMYFAKEDY